MSDDCDDLLDGDDELDERRNFNGDAILQHLDAPAPDLLATSAALPQQKYDIDFELLPSLSLPDDIDSDKDDDLTMDGVVEDKRKDVDMDVDETTTSSVTPSPTSTVPNTEDVSGTEELSLPGLTLAPGLNVFSQEEGKHAFKYFSFDDLCLEKDLSYERRPYLKGHGFSDQAIDDILSDKLTFLRHLMPEAQSVLIGNKNDFRNIMEFLFYCISVCTDRLMNDLLMKSFFSLAKNYSYQWKLTLTNVVTVMWNFDLHREALNADFISKHLSRHVQQNQTSPTKIQGARFILEIKKRRRNANGGDKNSGSDAQRLAVTDDKFTFCVSRFVKAVSRLFVSLPNRVHFHYKSKWNDLCVLSFIMALVGSDKRFIEDCDVGQEIKTMYHYLFNALPDKFWYCGAGEQVKQGNKFCLTNDSFPLTFCKMVHDFPPYGVETFCMWEKEKVTNISLRLDDHEHHMNVLHKIDLLPISYRGAQVKKFLAYLYLQTMMNVTAIRSNESPDIKSIIEENPDIKGTVTQTFIKYLIKRERYLNVYVIIKLWDIIVGNEIKESFAEERKPAIRMVLTEILEMIEKKLPQLTSRNDKEKLYQLMRLNNVLSMVKERWSNGCGEEEI
eukprot:TRINITY_DN12350_c0_g2_i1.p1 TRINITY_DN12350_c0_g2~~TRINITY_DN12350_c0_g2_i1.p1  ORF type:complete len:624 (-),score=160.73 TRINITY_DN12350_c0_g2_i1:394-2235(-)